MEDDARETKIEGSSWVDGMEGKLGKTLEELGWEGQGYPYELGSLDVQKRDRRR